MAVPTKKEAMQESLSYLGDVAKRLHELLQTPTHWEAAAVLLPTVLKARNEMAADYERYRFHPDTLRDEAMKPVQ